MAVKTVQGVAEASVKTVLGVANASVKTIMGVDMGGGGGFTPSDLTSLKRWIDASQFVGLSDNDPISTATDFSGQANHLTGSGTQRPTYQTAAVNSLPAMQFVRASSQFLTGSAVASGTAAMFWIVYQPDSITGFDTELFSTSFNSAYYRLDSDGDAYCGYYRGTRINTYPLDVPTTGTVIMVGVSTGSTYQIYLNGVGQGAQSADFAQESHLLLGTYADGVRHWNGFICEFGMCDADESASRGDLETYLAAKWQ